MSKLHKPIVTTVRLQPDMHAQMIEASDELHISSHSFMIQAISEKLKRGEWLDEAISQAKRSQDDGR